MTHFFSIDTVFFTVLDYPMSYIEFIGTIMYLWSVWLIAKRNMLTWPVGIISVLLYMALFYQIQLYSDAMEQVYYLGASVYGWWYWSKSKTRKDDLTAVSFSSGKAILCWLGVTAILSAILGWVMSNVSIWLPKLFPEPASYPYLDALTTVMSFVAMWLMVRKHIEGWIYWIIVDLVGIWLYFVKDVKFISLLYVILLVLAIKGFHDWRKVKGLQSDDSPVSSDA